MPSVTEILRTINAALDGGGYGMSGANLEAVYARGAKEWDWDQVEEERLNAVILDAIDMCESRGELGRADA